MFVFRGPPRKKNDRSYKKFDLEHFNVSLKSELEKLSDSSYYEFETAFSDVLNKHTPLKVKMSKHNNNSFMTKNLRKAIMRRSKFKNLFNKCRTHESWCNYKTQRNHCVSLLRKTKQQYFKNLNLTEVTDNKTFWRTTKPYFNEKGSGSDKIVLSGNESVLINEKEIANTMNNYFINIKKHLNLKPHTASNTMDKEQITSAFNNHISIKKIREVFPDISSNNFEFTKLTEQSVKNEVLKLNTKKSLTSGSIPATILKQSVETYLPFFDKSNKFSYH